MSYLSFNRVGGVLSPEQVSSLEAIFVSICDECGEDRRGELASQCAGVLIRSVQRGIEDTEILKDIRRAVIRRVRTCDARTSNHTAGL